MTLAELRTLDIPALWASLTPEQQTVIGEATLANQYALLVAWDNGRETTRAERSEAEDMANEAFKGIEAATEQAFPNIEWWEE